MATDFYVITKPGAEEISLHEEKVNNMSNVLIFYIYFTGI